MPWASAAANANCNNNNKPESDDPRELAEVKLACTCEFTLSVSFTKRRIYYIIDNSSYRFTHRISRYLYGEALWTKLTTNAHHE